MRSPTQERILSIIGNGKPKSSREIISSSGFTRKSIENALSRMWKSGLVLRTDKPFRENERVFRGRSGVKLRARRFCCKI